MRPLALCLALTAAAPLPAAGGPEAGRLERTVAVMGTVLTVLVEAPDQASALAASERAVRAVEAAEARLSTWRSDSELARLNQAPAGHPVALSPELAAELAAAAECWARTGGAFDPGVGPLVEAWGLRRGGRVPTREERAAAAAAGGLSGLTLARGGLAVRQRPGLRLEEGGFGKGAGLARAVAALAEVAGSRAVLNLGGQVALHGWSEPREVRIADPRRRERTVLSLTVEDGSVATSGNSERAFASGGARYGHILDPRSGEPARDFGSLTVWTEDPLAADCLATGLFVLGPEAALAWAAGQPGVEVVALMVEGAALRALASPGLTGRLRLLDDGVELSTWPDGPEARAADHPTARGRR